MGYLGRPDPSDPPKQPDLYYKWYHVQCCFEGSSKRYSYRIRLTSSQARSATSGATFQVTVNSPYSGKTTVNCVNIVGLLTLNLGNLKVAYLDENNYRPEQPPVDADYWEALSRAGYSITEGTQGAIPTPITDELRTQVDPSLDSALIAMRKYCDPRDPTKLQPPKQEIETMSMHTANRRVVNVQLLDNDRGLPVEFSLVGSWSNIVTEDNDGITIQEIIATGEVVKKITAHNARRTEQVDLGILERTGASVKLRPVKLKDLTWAVSLS